MRVTSPAASCRGSLGGPLPACRQPGPPGLALPQKAPGGSRGTRCTRPCGIVPQFAWRASARMQTTRPSGPGAPTKSPRRKPGDSGLHAFPGAMRCGFEPEIARRHPAWTAGWFSYPVSPGFHPGLFVTRANGTKSPRREPGDSGSHTFPGAMRCGFEPGNCVPSSGMDGGLVFTPGVPGFPPGAVCVGARPGGPG